MNNSTMIERLNMLADRFDAMAVTADGLWDAAGEIGHLLGMYEAHGRAKAFRDASAILRDEAAALSKE